MTALYLVNHLADTHVYRMHKVAAAFQLSFNINISPYNYECIHFDLLSFVESAGEVGLYSMCFAATIITYRRWCVYVMENIVRFFKRLLVAWPFQLL